MKRRGQIHLADAELAAQNGAWTASVAHCIAAEAAGAARSESGSTLQIALSVGRSAVGAGFNPAHRACFLAIEAMSTGEALALEELRRFMAEMAEMAASLSVEAVAAEADDADSLAIISQGFERLVAIGRLGGLNEASAIRQAGVAVIPRLDRLLARDPVVDDVRLYRVQRLLEVGRYRDALNDFRYLLGTQPNNPAVYSNLIALLRTPVHEEVRTSLTHALASLADDPQKLESEFHSLLYFEAVPEAFQALDRLIDLAPEFRMIRDLRAMADDLDQEPAHKFGVAPSGRHLIYASMVCWGGKYLELMEEIAIASLLSPQNLPALCAENDLVIDFVTMPEDAATLAAMPGIQALACLCEIRIYLFPQIDAVCRPHIGRFSYNFLGFGSALTMKRAERDGADLITLIPDVVYAEGSFAYVASLVTKEPCALLADGLNTFAAPMLKALERHRDRERCTLTVSIPDLIDYASQNFMPRTTDFYFDPDKPDVISYPQRIVFREKEGLVVHAFSKNPIYASHAAYAPLGQVNYGTPDSFLTNHLMKNLTKAQLHPTTSDMKFLLMELAEDNGRLWSRTTEPLIDAITEMYRNYGFHINCFNMFEVGERYPIRVPYSERLTTAAQREALLAELWDARQTRTVFTELCRERAKFDRAVRDPLRTA